MIVFSEKHVNCWDILTDLLRHVSRNLIQDFCVPCEIFRPNLVLYHLCSEFCKLKVGFEPENNEKTL